MVINKENKDGEKMEKTKFEEFENIRKSWLTNMFNITMVCELSGGILTKEDCLDIMKNYEAYKEICNKIKEVEENE